LIFLPKSKEEKEKFDDIYEDYKEMFKTNPGFIAKINKDKKKVKVPIKQFQNIH